MDVDSEVAPLVEEMAKRLAVARATLLPALQHLDEDTLLSFYTIDEQARLYLSAAFTLALSLYALDKITHRQVAGGDKAAPRLTGAGTRGGAAAASSGSTDTQLVLKIERITEYIKKLQELATLEKQKKIAAAAAAEAGKEGESAVTEPSRPGTKRARGDEPSSQTVSVVTAEQPPGKKSKTDTTTEEDVYGDADMFSVVSRVAGETGTLVSRLLKQVMSTASKAE